MEQNFSALQINENHHYHHRRRRRRRPSYGLVVLDCLMFHLLQVFLSLSLSLSLSSLITGPKMGR
jgi:hypothetical protein